VSQDVLPQSTCYIVFHVYAAGPVFIFYSSKAFDSTYVKQTPDADDIKCYSTQDFEYD